MVKPQKGPPLDWAQVEVTSRCNAACTYCPHTAFSRTWRRGDLPVEMLNRILSELRRCRLFYLQGWGEPLLHPDLAEMVGLVKKAGRRAGTTTNGSAADSETLRRLMGAGLDVLGFSLAGVDEGNDVVRRGAGFRQTARAVEEVQRIKAAGGGDPDIHLAYLALRSRLEDLTRLPRLAADWGVNQVVVSSLSLVVHPELAGEAELAKDEAELSALADTAGELRREAAARGVDLAFHVSTPCTPRRRCPENIGRSMVIGRDGGVGPCVMTRVPAGGGLTHYNRGREIALPQISFGNAGEEHLADIWKSKDYKRLRKSFDRGVLEPYCAACRKMNITDLNDGAPRTEPPWRAGLSLLKEGVG